ncbi:MAG: hypothetical protein ABIH78_02955 [Candidatus Peregrinibacteria bacterium]
MLYQVRKISMEQWFVILAFVLSLALCLLFGYTIFRYWQVDTCKTPMQTVWLPVQ